jgi:hypothetical protein
LTIAVPGAQSPRTGGSPMRTPGLRAVLVLVAGWATAAGGGMLAPSKPSQMVLVTVGPAAGCPQGMQNLTEQIFPDGTRGPFSIPPGAGARRHRGRVERPRGPRRTSILARAFSSPRTQMVLSGRTRPSRTATASWGSRHWFRLPSSSPVTRSAATPRRGSGSA